MTSREALVPDSWPPSSLEAEDAADRLAEAHERVRDHIRDMRRKRAGGAVFLVEHGLDPGERDLVERAVKVGLFEHGTSRRYWVRRFLPLGVVAAEVGYRYRGTGTEFWPRLASRLEFKFDHEARHWLRDRFARIGEITGVRPPDTPWAGHFHLMAWPVTHALLPVELHGKLLQAILRHPRAIREDMDPDQVLAPLVDWAERAGHLQLAAFLAQREPAVAVVRHFLGVEPPLEQLEPGILSRIVADLRDNTGTARDLRAARRRQRLLRRTERDHPGRPTAPTWAPLTLDLDTGGDPILWVTPPKVPPGVVPDHLHLLGARSRARLLGGRKVGIAELVAGHPVEVRARQLPDPGPGETVALVGDTPEDLPVQLGLHLHSAQADLQRPLLFADHAGPAFGAGQVRRRACFEGATWWVLSPQAPARTPPGVTRRGDVAGLTAYQVTPRTDEDFAWLAEIDIPREHRPIIRLVGSASFAGPSAAAVEVGKGDRLFLLVERGAVTVPPAGAPIPPGPVRVGVEGAYGTRTLCLRAPDGVDEILQIDIVRPPEPGDLVHLSLAAPDLSVEALVRRQVGLRIGGELPFSGLHARLRLEADEELLADVSVGPMPALPHQIGPSEPCWAVIQEGALRAGPATVRLTVEVGAVAQAQWWFEPAAWSVSWTSPSRAVDDLDALDLVVFAAAAPLVPNRGEPPPGDFALLQPLDRDTGRMRLSSGRVHGPASLASGALGASPRPRILRRLDAERRPGVVSAWRLVEAWVAWATAVGDGMLAEGVRRKTAGEVQEWVVEALCGTRWVEAERRISSASSPALGDLVADGIARAVLGRDEYLEDTLTEAGVLFDPSELHSAWVELFHEHRSLLRDLASADDDDPGFERLNRVLNDAYRIALGERLEQEEADIYHDADELRPVITTACRAWEEETRLSPLLPVMRPRWLAIALAELPYEGLGFEDLVERLEDTLRGKRAATLRWERPWVAALVELFTRPARFPIDETGRNAVGAALVDPSAARAVRYAVLRWAGRQGQVASSEEAS